MKALIQMTIVCLALTSFTVQAKGNGCKRRIEKACKAAGHKRKKDCYNKIIADETVEGVTPDLSDIAACKKHH